MDDLRAAKEELLKMEDHISEVPFHQPGFLDFNLLRRGAGSYPYVLRSGDVVLMFSNHKPDAQFPNCRIEIGSISCWQPGWLSLYNRILDWITFCGCRVFKEKVSEFHITADLLGADFSTTGFFDIDRWITRANDHFLAGKYGNHNYVAFGKGNFMMRVYDKTSELTPNSPKAIVFNTEWSKKLQAPPPKHVTRIEFQIRRTVSRELQIETVKDLAANLNGIWQYCVSDWARFTEIAITSSDRKNKNQQRYETAALWQFVQAIRFDAPESDKLIRRSESPNHINTEILRKMASGCLLSLCAASGLKPDDLLGHIHFSHDLIEKSLTDQFESENEKYKRKVETKSNLATITF
ncbi:MAG: hypothetical protein D3920_00900 [Candidatus Electrothrix sp. AW2]|nr:hypothetical protein [Candidatus Electrothrix gigas]